MSVPPPGYVHGPCQVVVGFEAYALGEVLRLHLARELDRWGLDADSRRRVEWAAAGVRRAGEQWRLSPAQHARESGRDGPGRPVPPSRPELLSTTEVAEMLEVTTARVAQLAREGTFGQKVGDAWVFTRPEVAAYSASHAA